MLFPHHQKFLAPLCIVAVGSPLLAQTQSPNPKTERAVLPRAQTRGLSSGNYLDREGKRVHWEINESHALLWNGLPYLPVGGTFTPRSLSSGGEEAWAIDQKRLTLLKEKGVLDLLIKPETSLARVPVAQIQRLVDFLDTNGFRYGLAFGTGMEAPLQSVLIKPNSYRQEVVEGKTAQFTVTDSEKALYYIIDLTDKEYKIINAGSVNVRDNTAVVPTEIPSGVSRAVVLLYPTKTPSANKTAALPDLWGGYDDYRDRLLSVLGKVKFGTGLRFFSDPLSKSLSLVGEADYSVPLSDSFRLEFEAYLSRQYSSLEDLRTAWDCLDVKSKSFQEMAKFVPLWANGRGVPYLLDVVSGQTHHINDSSVSKWWDDFLQFRVESIQNYMNGIATTLKKQIADVPVVYTWTQTHPIFLNNEKDGGFDGLSVVTRAGEDGALARVLGPAYSLVEQSSRTTWAIVNEIDQGDRAGVALTKNGVPNAANTLSISPFTQNNLFYELNRLRSVGYKGFYAADLTLEPKGAEPSAPLSLPDTGLAWLKDYGTKVEAERNAATYAPNVLFFPNDKPGPARVGWVPGDNSTLWLNGLKQGNELDWWPTVSGYVMSQGTGTQYVLTSLQGKRKIVLITPNAKGARANYTNGLSAPIKLVTKSQIEVTLDEKPLIVTIASGTLFPLEATTDIYLQLNALYQIGQGQKLPSIDSERLVLERTGIYIKQKDFEEGYSVARSRVDELVYMTSPYIWLEGENPYRNVHTLTEVATNPEASNSQYLRLSTPNAPGRLGYGARYVFNIAQDAKYNVWMACSVPGPNTSPIRWRVNSEPEQEPLENRIQGIPFVNERFGWQLLGSVDLRKGPGQSFSFYVVDRAQSGDYNFAVDSILITPKSFVPNGRVRPLPIEFQALKAYKNVGTALGYDSK